MCKNKALFLSETDLGKTLVPSKYPILILIARNNGLILALVTIFDRLFSFRIKFTFCCLYSSPVMKLIHLTKQNPFDGIKQF